MLRKAMMDQEWTLTTSSTSQPKAQGTVVEQGLRMLPTASRNKRWTGMNTLHYCTQTNENNLSTQCNYN